MKKTVLMISFLFVSCIAFAGGWIGVETGAGFSWTDVRFSGDGKDAGTGTVSAVDFHASVAGAHYFTDSLGLGYSADIIYPVSAKTQDADFYDDFEKNITFKPALSFQFKHDFSRSMSLEAGAGAYFSYQECDLDLFGAIIKAAVMQAGAGADLGFSFEMMDHLLLRAGVNVIVPVFTWLRISYESHSSGVDMSEYGAGVLPYIGLAYSY